MGQSKKNKSKGGIIKLKKKKSSKNKLLEIIAKRVLSEK